MTEKGIRGFKNTAFYDIIFLVFFIICKILPVILQLKGQLS